MRNLFISLACMTALCAAPVAAHGTMRTMYNTDTPSADTLHLGYCNGEYSKVLQLKSSGKGYTEAAIRLTPEALSAYKGNSIVGVRAALTERINTDTLRVWVRRQLDGDNIAQGYVLRKGTEGVVKGWNSVVFDTPLDITADMGDLYIGYSLHHKATVSAISVMPLAIDKSSYVRLNHEDWQDYSSKGTVCVEALVSGDHIPVHDLGLGAATLTPAPASGVYAVKGSVQVHNYGTQAVPGFTIELGADGKATRSLHFDKTIASLADSTLTFAADMGIATDENTSWTLRLTGIDGATDEIAENNATSPIYKFLRNVLIEEFTTEKCVNCPRAAAYLHGALENPDLKGRLVAITHHAGFYTDRLTQPCDEELLALYNNGESVYAPGMAFNRQPYFTTNGSDKPTAVVNPTSQEFIEAYSEYEMSLPANATLDMRLNLNSDSTRVDVVVGGVCTSVYNTKNPYICLYLLENDVKAKSQTGADGNYMQQHVNRAYNSTWGDPVEWADRRFSYTYSFDIDPSWVKRNMEVAAFVYNYDADDPANCVVDNSVAVKLLKAADDPATAISSVDATAVPHVVAEYTLGGQRASVKGMSHGVVLQRMSDGSTRKVVK